MLLPVILSGGAGTRLWPLSRKNLPKQFLDLLGDGSLFQQALQRAHALQHADGAIVVCSEEHRFLVAEQLRESQASASILLEPLPRNTAPAIALAAWQARSISPDATLLAMPADHRIGDVQAFVAAAHKALPFAQQGWLVTFGIRPGHAETGYGYIQRGDRLDENVFRVGRFVEKPDAARAQQYVESGEHEWNSGIFLFRADRYLEELQRHAPAMHDATRRAFEQANVDADFIRADKDAFAQCPSDSIDYAIMEKTDRAAVVPIDCQWSDIGSWSALWKASPRDGEGNHIEGDVIALDSRDCFVRAARRRMIAVLGMREAVIVDTPDALLVAPMERAQQVGRIVQQLESSGRQEHLFHRKVHRPWGNYDSLESDEGFQVKRIVVKPGAALSLQKHRHRAEHWIVVAGTAEVTRDEEVFTLRANESTFLPLGAVHRLRNTGEIPLELIEVQVGDYLGEDDIVRLEDIYGRA